MNSVLSPGDILFMITSNAKYNFIIGQCALAEIPAISHESKLISQANLTVLNSKYCSLQGRSKFGVSKPV